MQGVSRLTEREREIAYSKVVKGVGESNIKDYSAMGLRSLRSMVSSFQVRSFYDRSQIVSYRPIVPLINSEVNLLPQ